MDPTSALDRLIASILILSRTCNYDGADIHCALTMAATDAEHVELHTLIGFVDAATARAQKFQESR